MPKITRSPQIITFTGPALDLISAPFAGSVTAVYRFNASGGGFSGYTAGANYNSLSQLIDGEGYVVFSSQLGYLIPDSPLLSAALPAGGSEIVFLSGPIPIS